MKGKFDELVDRRNSNSVKWDMTEEIFGEKDLLPLWVADMDFKIAEPILQAIRSHLDHGIYGYPAKPDSLFDAVISWCGKRHQWNVKKDWIRFTPGVVPAISMVINAFTNPGDKVIIQSPVYPPFFDMVTKNDRKLVNNPLIYKNGRYIIDFEDFEKKLDTDVKLMILCNPHNPVGRVWTSDELSRLADLCIRNNVLLVSDEIHSDLIFRGHKHTPLASLSGEVSKNTITFIAPSKTFNLAGLQTAVAIIENEKHREVLNNYIARLGMSFTNTIGLVATEAAYSNGEEWLEGLIDYLSENLLILKKFINDRLPIVKVVEPEGTYLVWLDFRALDLGNKELEQLMIKKAKVALNWGYTFGSGGAGFARINIACHRETLKNALENIEAAIDSL